MNNNINSLHHIIKRHGWFTGRCRRLTVIEWQMNEQCLHATVLLAKLQSLVVKTVTYIKPGTVGNLGRQPLFLYSPA